jgi:hypothetical protein
MCPFHKNNFVHGLDAHSSGCDTVTNTLSGRFCWPAACCIKWCILANASCTYACLNIETENDFHYGRPTVWFSLLLLLRFGRSLNGGVFDLAEASIIGYHRITSRPSHNALFAQGLKL